MKLIPVSRHSTTSGTKFVQRAVRHKQDENEAPLAEQTFNARRKRSFFQTSKVMRTYQEDECRLKAGKKSISRCCAPSVTQRMSVHELKALSRQIDLSSKAQDTKAKRSPGAPRLLKTCDEVWPSRDEIASLSQQLRTNLSLAKLKLMATLSHSQAPKDIHVYECLRKNVPSIASIHTAVAAANTSLSTINTHRTLNVRRTTVGNGKNLFKRRVSRLQLNICTNANRCVTSTPEQPFSRRRSSSFSTNFPILHGISSDDSDEAETPLHTFFGAESPYQHPSNLSDPCSPLMMPVADTHDPPPMSPTGIDKLQVFLKPWGGDTDDAIVTSDTQHELATHLNPTFSVFGHGENVTEDEINSWLQQGGGDHSNLAMVTDQELADLFDFDVLPQS